MCGIIGYAALSGPHENRWLLEARDSMSYRGPDNAGAWLSDSTKVAFGHRRLSIIGMNEDSNQPFVYYYNSKKYVITFNGEIYNFEILRENLRSLGYCFSTDSDTEVLLVSYVNWKEHCLKELEGMFSFVIYDVEEKKVFFARDRAGEKPFYYFLSNGCFYFSSEFLPLVSHPHMGRSIDRSSILEYLNLGFLSEGKSFNNEIKKLTAGHYGYYHLDESLLHVVSYFQLSSIRSNFLNYDMALSSFDEVFRASVKKQLRSDVPVGVLLSGGIDSSLISCVANSINSNVTNYTVDFGDNKEELRNAKVISDFYGCDHKVLRFSEISTHLFDEIIASIDEPIADSSFVPTYLISEFINKNGGKVVLGGDGADELFGGYSYHVNVPRIVSKLKYFPDFIAMSFEDLLSSPYMFTNLKVKKWVDNLGSLSKGIMPNMREVFTKRELLEITSGHSANHRMDLIYNDYYNADVSVFKNLTTFDFKFYLGSNVLVKNDRASMLMSIETRAPFLDESIINFAFALPDSFKIRNNIPKSFLTDYATRIFPSHYSFNRKRGFNFTDKFVSSAVWSDYFRKTIATLDIEFINKKYLNFLVDNLGKGEGGNFIKVYSVIVLSRWITKNKLIIK